MSSRCPKRHHFLLNSQGKEMTDHQVDVRPAYAYWIAPDGCVVDVAIRHIITVCNAPERFGMTHEQINEAFVRHGEPLGHEGRARQEIMAELIINHGWIRVRYLPRHDRWTIELNRFDNQARAVVRHFFKSNYAADTSRALMSCSDVVVHEISGTEQSVTIHTMQLHEFMLQK